MARASPARWTPRARERATRARASTAATRASRTPRVARASGDVDGDADEKASDAARAARGVDASIEALRSSAVARVEEMLTADDGVRRELERAKAAAKEVAAREVDKAAETERKRVEEAYEKTRGMASDVQSRAVVAAEEAVALKASAVVAAEAKMKAAEEAREALRRELEREDASGGKWADASVNEEAEKMESAKAAVVAGAGGTLLATPLALSQGGGLVSLGVVAASCAVFGVTYRYAVRRDLGNNELKGGVVGAFGLARGLSAADVYLRAAAVNGDADFAAYAQAALLAGQGVLTYAFAAVALEQAFARGFLKPFGTASEETER